VVRTASTALRTTWGRFAITFVLVLACLVLWALAMPLFSAPDEGAHMVKAYAVVHGEAGRLDPETGRRYFLVPAVIDHGGDGDNPCFAFLPDQTADCLELHQTGPEHEVSSSAASYPPFFHLAVGWPSLVTSGSASLYLMRLAGAVLVALFMALAVESAARMRARAPLLLGLAVAVSPAVLYFGAMVNPSGLTIAAALAAWTGGIFLGRGPQLEHMGWAVARVGLPLCVVVLLRRDSVVWGGLIIAALVVLTPWDRLRQLVRCRALWAWAVAIVGCAGAQLALAGAETGGALAGEGAGGSFWNAVNDANFIARGAVGGILGWFDVALPFPVFPIYLVSTGFLVIAAIGFASRRVGLTLLGMTIVAVAVPVAVGSIRWPYFQGRYLLPLIVGVAIVGGLGLAEALGRVGLALPRRLLWLLFPILVFAQAFSFAQALRRYVSGATQDWWIFSTPKWRPAAGDPTVVVVLYAGAVVALFAWWYLLARADGPGEGPVDEPDPGPPVASGRFGRVGDT